jgi:hypothetical protein
MDHKREPVLTVPGCLLGFREPTWRSVYHAVRVLGCSYSWIVLARFIFCRVSSPQSLREAQTRKVAIQPSMGSSSARYLHPMKFLMNLELLSTFPQTTDPLMPCIIHSFDMVGYFVKYSQSAQCIHLRVFADIVPVPTIITRSIYRRVRIT